MDHLSASISSSAADFLRDGGEMGALMRELDWSQTPLGPAPTWPPALKTAVRLMLTSRQPRFVWWGEQFINLYNDACRILLGDKHPRALAQPASEVWGEIWEQTGQQAEAALYEHEDDDSAGDEPRLLMIERDEETCYTFSWSPITDGRGARGGLLCTATDETQRLLGERQLTLLREQSARTAAALRATEERFALFMRHLPGLAWIKDLEGRYIFVNEAAERAFRRRRAEICGRTDEEIFPPETAAQFRINDLRALESEGGIETIETLEHEDGPHHSLVNKFPIAGAEGRPALIGGMAIDITWRIKIEEALLAANTRLEERVRERTAELTRVSAQYRAIFDQGLFAGLIAPDGTLIDANRSSLETCGFRLDDVVGRPYWETGWWNRSAEVQAWLKAGFAQAIAGESFRGESIYFVADGSARIIDLAFLPIKDEAGRLLFVIAKGMDITDRRRAEQERKAAEVLREADRRKDEFLATLAHELRNPLAPIRNALRIMRLAKDRPEQIEEARELVERQFQQMVRLIDDLLDVSRISRDRIELQRERVDLSAVIQNALEVSLPLIEQSHHRLTLRLPPEPVLLDADLTRLAQVFANLLNNAAKYTPSGGQIEIAAARSGNEVTISVKDNGVGIPEMMLPHVFEMFTQVDRSLERSQGGLGIGLSIARRLVEMHGGTIEARSAGRLQGSEFVVRLPALTSSIEEPQPVNDEETPPATSRRRILVADDNQDSAASLAMILEILGHEVRTAGDGLEAVEAAATFRPDAILLDIGMPKLNGYDACRRIREQPWGAEAMIVAITGWGQDEDRRRSLEAGFNHHLVKPIDPDTLERLLAASEQE